MNDSQNMSKSYNPLMLPIDIIKYALEGLIYILIHLPQDIYFIASGSVDKAYKKTKGIVTETAGEGKANLSAAIDDSAYAKNKRLKLEAEREELLKILASDEAKRVTKATIYQYTAQSKEGKIITGTFTGFSLLDVNSFLINEGYLVFSIKTSKMISFLHGESKFLPQKMTNKDLIFWLSQLATYIKSGIPLTDAVRIIANSMGKKNKQKTVYERLVYELSMGESFSKALEKQGTIFPGLLINMLKAAEATGELAETLEDMADYYTETEKTRKQVISAMTYPSIIMVFALGVVTFIMLYVIPQFIEVYDSVGVELKGITKAVIGISLFLQQNITFVILILLATVGSFMLIYKKVKAFRTVIQTVLMKLPVVGNIMIYKEITIFSKTFASLLKNNVFITDSIDILSKITNNEIYKQIMFQTISNIAKGEKISVAFKDHWAVPEIAYHMILTGESTGELPTMLSRVSDYFQEMNRSAISALKSFIEPIMIAFLAVIVGVVILSVIIPMFGLYEEIQM